MDPDLLLKDCPNVAINPNLSRDVLGIIFAHHRDNVEKYIRRASVQTLGGEVPNDIVIDALKTKIRFYVCGANGCESYHITVEHSDDCSCNDTDCAHTQGAWCIYCAEWFCHQHLYMFALPSNNWPDELCITCASDLKCDGCDQMCTGFTAALEHAVPISKSRHINQYTCTSD